MIAASLAVSLHQTRATFERNRKLSAAAFHAIAFPFCCQSDNDVRNPNFFLYWEHTLRRAIESLYPSSSQTHVTAKQHAAGLGLSQ